MNEITTGTVSADDAVKKGYNMVKYPALVIFLIPVPICGYFIGILHTWPMWSIGAGLFVGAILATIYQNRMIVKWKIWAFDNVQDVEELKAKAIKAKLLDADDHFFAKISFAADADIQTLGALQAEYGKDDIVAKDLFVDDPKVPAETAIYFSKNKAIWGCVISAAGIGVGIFFFIEKYNHFYGILILGISILSFYVSYGESKNSKPQLILNDKGIESAGAGFHQWSEIINERVIGNRSTPGAISTSFSLIYNCQDKKTDMNIDDYTIEHLQLQHLLEIYRGRYEKNSKHMNG